MNRHNDLETTAEGLNGVDPPQEKLKEPVWIDANKPEILKAIENAGLHKCLNGTGVTSENYKQVFEQEILKEDQNRRQT